MLGRALASVLGQTYRNLEVIVADDNVPGSVCDIATREEVARRADGDGRVRLVPTAGGVGGGAARSLACGQAGGEYLAFLDDDDEFLPDKVQTQLRFKREAGLDMSWQDVAWYDERGGLVERRVLDHCRDFSREGLLRRTCSRRSRPRRSICCAARCSSAPRGSARWPPARIGG